MNKKNWNDPEVIFSQKRFSVLTKLSKQTDRNSSTTHLIIRQYQEYTTIKSNILIDISMNPNKWNPIQTKHCTNNNVLPHCTGPTPRLIEYTL